jgi:hypothetical protein
LAIAAFGQTYKRINKVMRWGKLDYDLWEIKLWKGLQQLATIPRLPGRTTTSERSVMLVTPYPGANRDDVLRTLRDLTSAAQNAGTCTGQRRPA